jgi:hypothetical protein
VGVNSGAEKKGEKEAVPGAPMGVGQLVVFLARNNMNLYVSRGRGQAFLGDWRAAQGAFRL